MDKPHKKLIAWQKSMDLVEKAYELTKKLPREELHVASTAETEALVDECLTVTNGLRKSLA